MILRLVKVLLTGSIVDDTNSIKFIKFTNSPEEGDALLKQLKVLQHCDAYKVASALMIVLIRIIFYQFAVSRLWKLLVLNVLKTVQTPA